MPPSATHREWAKCKSQSELHDTRLNHFKTSMETKFAPAADPVQEVPSLTATHSRSAAHLPALLTYIGDCVGTQRIGQGMQSGEWAAGSNPDVRKQGDLNAARRSEISQANENSADGRGAGMSTYHYDCAPTVMLKGAAAGVCSAECPIQRSSHAL
jgi:hypothetical protein